MKKKTGFIIVISLVLLISGCIPSIHPLYFNKDRLVLNELEGKWLSESDDIWEFVKIENEPSYTLSYSEHEQKGAVEKNSTTAIFEANVVKLGGHYFIDLYPGDNDYLEKMNSFLAVHLITAHTFLKLEVKDEQLVIYQMSPKWLEDLFKENKIRIKHETVVDEATVNSPDNVFKSPMAHESIILTASTKELQKFITKYAEDEDAFGEPEILNPIR